MNIHQCIYSIECCIITAHAKEALEMAKMQEVTQQMNHKEEIAVSLLYTISTLVYAVPMDFGVHHPSVLPLSVHLPSILIYSLLFSLSLCVSISSPITLSVSLFPRNTRRM